MDRNVQRVNGEVVRLHRLSDDEIETYMAGAHGRIEAATHDLEVLGIESARRYALADAALSDTVEFPAIEDPAQGKLFHFPDRMTPTPPDAA